MASDIKETIEWALETKREKLMFGLDELNAALARERRLFGVLLDCQKHIEKIEGALEYYADPHVHEGIPTAVALLDHFGERARTALNKTLAQYLRV